MLARAAPRSALELLWLAFSWTCSEASFTRSSSSDDETFVSDTVVSSPFQVPEEYEKPFMHIKNKARRTFSGMVLAMDEAVRDMTLDSETDTHLALPTDR